MAEIDGVDVISAEPDDYDDEPLDEVDDVDEVDDPGDEEEAEEEEGGDEVDEGDEEEREEVDDEGDEDFDDSRAASLRAESLERERDHWRSAHDRLSGTHGETTRKLRARLKEAVDTINELRGGEGDDVPRHPATLTPPRDSRIDKLVADADERKQDKAQQVLVQTIEQFELEAGDGQPLPRDLAEAVRDHFREHRDTIDEYVQAGDQESTAVVTQRILSEGLLRGITARKERNTKRGSKQADALRRRKSLATPAGAAPRRARPSGEKKPEDMTLEELEAHFAAEGRKGFKRHR